MTRTGRTADGCPGGLDGLELTACAFVLLAAVLLLAGGVWLGDLNQDEGWYLYAARQVAAGQIPYLDFASTQGPVMAYVYGWFQPLYGAYGVLGGRLFTAGLGLLNLLLAGWLAVRLTAGRRRVLLPAWIFCGVNVYQAYFFSLVKTYALTGALFTAGAVAATYVRGRRPRLAALAAGGLWALAAATRSSAVVALPALFVWWLWQAARREQNAQTVRVSRWVPFVFAGAAAAVLLGCFGPLLVRNFAAVWFALVEYHAGRDAGGLVLQLAYKGGFVARLWGAYQAALLFPLLLLLAGWCVPRLRRGFVCEPASPEVGLAAAVALVSLVHLAAPFPYDDYQTFLWPVVSALLAVWCERAVRQTSAATEGRIWRATVLGVLLLQLAATAASPVLHGWFIGERDRIWWPLKEEAPLKTLQRAGAQLAAWTHPDELLLTQDLYLAVEADRSVPRGLELGPFSYFPDWSDEKAAARHVLNRAGMERLLATTPAPVAAFSAYSLAIRCPDVQPLSDAERQALLDALHRRYEFVEQIDRFGQAATTLRLYRLRGQDDD